MLLQSALNYHFLLAEVHTICTSKTCCNFVLKKQHYFWIIGSYHTVNSCNLNLLSISLSSDNYGFVKQKVFITLHHLHVDTFLFTVTKVAAILRRNHWNKNSVGKDQHTNRHWAVPLLRQQESSIQAAELKATAPRPVLRLKAFQFPQLSHQTFPGHQSFKAPTLMIACLQRESISTFCSTWNKAPALTYGLFKRRQDVLRGWALKQIAILMADGFVFFLFIIFGNTEIKRKQTP